MYAVITKVLIGCVVTTQLICAFDFAYAKSRFSHDKAYFFMEGFQWPVSTGMTVSSISSRNKQKTGQNREKMC